MPSPNSPGPVGIPRVGAARLSSRFGSNPLLESSLRNSPSRSFGHPGRSPPRGSRTSGRSPGHGTGPNVGTGSYPGRSPSPGSRSSRSNLSRSFGNPGGSPSPSTGGNSRGSSPRSIGNPRRGTSPSIGRRSHTSRSTEASARGSVIVVPPSSLRSWTRFMFSTDEDTVRVTVIIVILFCALFCYYVMNYGGEPHWTEKDDWMWHYFKEILAPCTTLTVLSGLAVFICYKFKRAYLLLMAEFERRQIPDRNVPLNVL